MTKPWQAAFHAVNSNTPTEQLFALLVDDVYSMMRGISGLGLNACAFVLGEKLAYYRNKGVRPDAEVLGELAALYRVLAEDFQQPYFQELQWQNQQQLLKSVYSKRKNRHQGDDATVTPPDVQTMLPIYNAVWHLHYQEFLNDPAAAISAWNVKNVHQNRAIRAVLFDMDYDRLALLCLMMAESLKENLKEDLREKQGGNKKLKKIIEEKANIMLIILTHRVETPDYYAAELLTLNGQEPYTDLTTLITALKERNVLPKDVLGFVVPVPSNISDKTIE
jgi:hypothetical protein